MKIILLILLVLAAAWFSAKRGASKMMDAIGGKK